MLIAEDLGTMEYRQAWAFQEAVHEEVANGGNERLLLVEHPDVITLGRRPAEQQHLLADPAALQKLGVTVVHSDRGGDVTFHGPGQVVAYPIIRLNSHRLSVGGYIRLLERSVIALLAQWGITASREDGAVGIWTPAGHEPAKICAIGVRIRRGTTLHGLALNVRTDLSRFNLIVPCGLNGRQVTSLEKLLGKKTPDMDLVKSALISALQNALNESDAA